MHRFSKQASWAIVAAIYLTCSGCFFAERSFPMDPKSALRAAAPVDLSDSRTTRQWLVATHETLKPALPKHPKPALLTEQLTDPQGEPVDMVQRFAIRTWGLESIWTNFLGLCYSAQASSTRTESSVHAPPPGFADVWVPISDDLQLAGRLGLARTVDGQVADADCIVILPGIHGGQDALRTRDLATALEQSGFHVLTLDLRGQGQTEARYPTCKYAWGVLETDDLLIVSDWLTRQPHIRRTGLVGYSWGANQALLVAWRDGRPEGDTSITAELAKHLRPLPPGRRYQAGIIAFSPILRFEDLMDELVRRQLVFVHPVRAGLQRTVREWMVQEKYPHPDGSIRNLIQYSAVQYPGSGDDSLQFLRFLPCKGQAAFDKLGPARMPVLIVHAADDPIAPAQTIADLFARVHNPGVAAIVLPSGGHIGFGPYATAWYYSLIRSFFDPGHGPRSCASVGRI